MLKNLIVIENGKSYQFDTEQELVREMISKDYYELSQEEKEKILEKKAIANSLNTRRNILEDVIDEKSLILSVLINNKILILMEKKDSNIFTKGLDKSNFNKNYILVNEYAEQLLEEYKKGK